MTRKDPCGGGGMAAAGFVALPCGHIRHAKAAAGPCVLCARDTLLAQAPTRAAEQAIHALSDDQVLARAVRA